MKYLNEIERLGGLRRLFPKSKTSLKDEEIIDLEKRLKNSLPEEFKNFIFTFGIYRFNEEVEFKPFSDEAEYLHSEESGELNFIFESSSINVFYGIDPEDDKTYDIFENLEIYKNRIPHAFLPFANDGMGNQILISLNQMTYGFIYFWDHECEWDEEEMGVKMDEKIKYQNLWLIGKSLSDFFSRIQILK